MPTIAKLLDSLPEIDQSRLVASGYGVWVVWNDELNKAINNTFRDYGALLLVEESDQALWYCNSTEVFRALARLSVWARVNPMAVSIVVMPASFLADYEMVYSLSLGPDLDRQEASYPAGLEVLIHPKLKRTVEEIHGLGMQVRGGVKGLAPVEWLDLMPDQGLDYESNHKWYFIIKALGNVSEKDVNSGWRALSLLIIELLRRMGLKYISDVEEGALYVPLDNFQLFRSFCIEIQKLIAEAKESSEDQYWPVSMAAVSQKDNDFSTGLPKRVGLDWGRMSPDLPHVKLMDALLLSEWFHLNETRYGTDAISLDTWCTISVKDSGSATDNSSLQVILPMALVGADGPHCYYCGHTNHRAVDCPSKQLSQIDHSIWQQISRSSIKEFSKGFAKVDSRVDETDYPNTMLALLNDTKGIEGLLSRAVFEINSPCQLRTLKMVWRTRAKDWAEGLKQLAPQEGDFVWDALHRIENGDLDNAEVQIREAQLKYPRSYQPHSLWGFWHMEKGDMNQAQFHWQEAERMSYTPLQQGYFAYLQGRLLEVEGNLKEAVNIYKRANTHSPTWMDPVYRQGVCMVKMGFTGQAVDVFSDLIDRDPHIFNRILLDPELDRGRVQLMSSLWDKWTEVDAEVKQAKVRVDELTSDIQSRFDEDHGYYEYAMEELDRLRQLADTDNYVAYRLLLSGTDRFKQNLDGEVRREIKRIESNLDYQTERVREVRKEAAWFPFPRLLVDFNKDFNYCVNKINWIKTQQLSDADKFCQTMHLIDKIEEHIDKLQSRLVTLKIVRDSTLFILMLGRNFIWLELILLGLALVTVPTTLYFTNGMEGNWILDTIRSQEWEFTKGLVIILSIVSLASAAIKTGLTFDKRKRELFDQIDSELRETAPKRY